MQRQALVLQGESAVAAAEQEVIKAHAALQLASTEAVRYGQLQASGAGSLQQMQEKLQRQMAEMKIEGQAGGGMVTVVINGHKAMLSITIDPEAVSKDDVEMLQDLVLAAINDAHRKADEQLSQQMSGLMGGMGMPGLR